jgi:methionine salvage enolase-phosphatase E1
VLQPNAPDVTPLLSGYFDTTTGPKIEADSYVKIAQALGVPPSRILFLTDLHLEAVAATKAGCGMHNRGVTFQPSPSRYAVCSCCVHRCDRHASVWQRTAACRPQLRHCGGL